VRKTVSKLVVLSGIVGEFYRALWKEASGQVGESSGCIFKTIVTSEWRAGRVGVPRKRRRDDMIGEIGGGIFGLEKVENASELEETAGPTVVEDDRDGVLSLGEEGDEVDGELISQVVRDLGGEVVVVVVDPILGLAPVELVQGEVFGVEDPVARHTVIAGRGDGGVRVLEVRRSDGRESEEGAEVIDLLLVYVSFEGGDGELGRGGWFAEVGHGCCRCRCRCR
jgi:hypothetical protein